MSAGELAKHFAFSKPTPSVHFYKLKNAELGAVECSGASIIYHLNTSILEGAVASHLSLKEHDE